MGQSEVSALITSLLFLFLFFKLCVVLYVPLSPLVYGTAVALFSFSFSFVDDACTERLIKKILSLSLCKMLVSRCARGIFISSFFFYFLFLCISCITCYVLKNSFCFFFFSQFFSFYSILPPLCMSHLFADCFQKLKCKAFFFIPKCATLRGDSKTPTEWQCLSQRRFYCTLNFTFFYYFFSLSFPTRFFC